MKTIKSVAILNKGPVAQRLEQYTHNVLVPGSNPGGPTKKYLHSIQLLKKSSIVLILFFHKFFQDDLIYVEE